MTEPTEETDARLPGQKMNRAEAASLAAAIALCLYGQVYTLIMPVYAGHLVEVFGLQDSAVSRIGFAEVGIGTVSVFLLCLFFRRINLRKAAFGALVLTIAANIAGQFPVSFDLFLILRGLHSLGSILLFGLGLALIGASRSPERFFAIYFIFAVLWQSLLLVTVPVLTEAAGYRALFIIMVILALPLLWATRAIPATTAVKAAVPASSVSSLKVAATALIAVALFGAYLGPTFAYVERIGDQIGLTLETIGLYLSLSVIAGILGSLFAAFLGDRYGTLRPLIFGTLVGLAGQALLFWPSGEAGYFIALCIFSMVWSFNMPFLFGSLAAADRSGRFAALTEATSTMSGAAAMIVFIPLVDLHGPGAVIAGASVFLTASLLAALFIRNRNARPVLL